MRNLLINGESGAGKSTILNYMKEDKFKSDYIATAKEQNEKIEEFEIYDMSGSENLKAELEKRKEKLKYLSALYLYVFDTSKYDTDANIKKGIDLMKEECDSNGKWVPFVIGTHAKASGKSLEEIKNLKNEIKKKGIEYVYILELNPDEKIEDLSEPSKDFFVDEFRKALPDTPNPISSSSDDNSWLKVAAGVVGAVAIGVLGAIFGRSGK